METHLIVYDIELQGVRVLLFREVKFKNRVHSGETICLYTGLMVQNKTENPQYPAIG